MPSGNVPSFTDYAGGQSPADLFYIAKSPFGLTDDRKNTLNNTFSEITKNITDGALRFGGFAAPAVSVAGKGVIYFDSAVNVFEGSRNAGAFQPLLFGSGSNTQIAYWGATVDTLQGNAVWTIDDGQISLAPTVALAHSGISSSLIQVTSTDATDPNIVALGTRVSGFYSGISAGGTGGTAGLVLRGVRSGGLAPLSGNTSASISLGSNNSTSITGGTQGGAITIAAITTENQGASNRGHGLVVRTIINGQTTDNTVININKYGVVQIGANGTQPSAELGGSTMTYKVVLGNLTLYNTDCAIQCGNPSTGPTTQKTFLVQANPSQTATVFGTQSSSGGDQFQVRVIPGVVQHFLSLLGTGTAPSTSVATQWRLYCGAAGEFLLSQGGAAYSQVLTAAGGTISGAVIITSNAASAFAVGPNGDTNPVIRIVANVASAATGLSITGNAAGSGVTLTALSSAADEAIRLTTKGSAGFIVTANNLFGFTVGPNGTTNPALQVSTNTASAETGILITSLAAGNGVTLTAQSSGPNETINVTPKGSGIVNLTTGQYWGPSASQTLPTFAMNDGSGNKRDGMYYDSAWGPAFTQGGTASVAFGGAFMGLKPTLGLGWNSGAIAGSFSPDTGFFRSAAAVVRLTNGSTGAGSLIVGPSTASIGTSGVAVLAVFGSTAPSTSSADGWQAYSVDWNGGGTAAPHFRTEDGTIWRLGGTALSTSANAIANLGTAAESFIQLFLDQTLTAGGTTGNQTINKSAGSVNFAAAATTLTVTCNKCTTSSIVVCTVLTDDATATIKNVVPGAGSFVITLTAAATAETRVGFWVLNQ